jgi:NAD(P)-dependent dehydrogenase (short-subunit alcohol dehydrogenase family)
VVSDKRRSILVTGASGGVGRGIAIAAARSGWDVWVTARRKAEGTAVSKEVDRAGGHGHFVECDVTDEASVASAFLSVAESTDTLHGVVHNATSGFSSRSSPLDDITLDNLQDQVAVSIRGMYLVARAAFPLLQGVGGSYLVTTSEAGFEGKKLLAAYAMVKAAQRGMMRSLAREWGPAGIRVNAIAPLASSPAMDKAFVSDPEMRDRVNSRISLGRLGDATEDIGTVVRFLLSDDARYVTGQTVMVDGGSCPIT